MIKSLKKCSKKDSLVIGGKGANLGELIRAGFPVPMGFVFSGKVSNKKILEEYKELGAGPVAVRSSATVEDMPGTAFAGQFETRLNVIGEKDLLKAIREVKDSIRSDRVVSYCKRNGIDFKKIRMSVVVQKMLDADFAGILFTVNPISGDRKESIVESNPGLGEAIVSGMVTPERYLLRKKFWRWQIVEYEKGDQKVIIKSKKGGGTKNLRKLKFKNLPKGIATKLAEMGDKIEKHFSMPQDIEWAVVGKEIFILQSRPITTLSKIKTTKISRLLTSMIAGIIPDRPLPLENSTLGIEQIFKKLLYPLMKLVGFKGAPIKEIFKEEEGIFVSYTGRQIARPGLGVLLLPFKLIKSVLFYRALKWKEDSLVSDTLASIEKLESENLRNKEPKELMKHAQKTVDLLNPIMEIRLRYIPGIAAAGVLLYVLLFFSGRRKEFSELIFSNLSTKVTETNEKLEKMTDKIRVNKNLKKVFVKNEVGKISSQLKKSEEGKEFLKEFEEFLSNYGYRESKGTLNISNPTWKESPELVLGILKGAVSSPEIKKSPKKKLKPFYFKRILREVQYFQELREDTRFYIMMLMPTLRDAFLRLGNYMVKAKVIKKSSDIFYFKFAELKKAVRNYPFNAKAKKKLHNLYERRKQKFLELQNVPFMDPKYYRTSKSKGGAFLVGTSGSPGEVEGQARVINDMSEFKNLRPGEILVAPYTSPAWTPLFENALGVVVDTGGVMSHAAIVAREYGIPAVMGTTDGTKKIKTGDKLLVDGTKGEVFKLE